VILDRRLSRRFSLLNGARPLNESRSPGGFPTTHSSRVSRAGEPGGDDAIEALAELCAAYCYPIYALVRRLGHSETDALDLTQEYFARLLEKLCGIKGLS
jgi:hypothetical protein